MICPECGGPMETGKVEALSPDRFGRAGEAVFYWHCRAIGAEVVWARCSDTQTTLRHFQRIHRIYEKELLHDLS